MRPLRDRYRWALCLCGWLACMMLAQAAIGPSVAGAQGAGPGSAASDTPSTWLLPMNLDRILASDQPLPDVPTHLYATVNSVVGAFERVMPGGELLSPDRSRLLLLTQHRDPAEGRLRVRLQLKTIEDAAAGRVTTKWSIPWPGSAVPSTGTQQQGHTGIMQRSEVIVAYDLRDDSGGAWLIRAEDGRVTQAVHPQQGMVMLGAVGITEKGLAGVAYAPVGSQGAGAGPGVHTGHGVHAGHMRVEVLLFSPEDGAAVGTIALEPERPGTNGTLRIWGIAGDDLLIHTVQHGPSVEARALRLPAGEVLWRQRLTVRPMRATLTDTHIIFETHTPAPGIDLLNLRDGMRRYSSEDRLGNSRRELPTLTAHLASTADTSVLTSATPGRAHMLLAGIDTTQSTLRWRMTLPMQVTGHDLHDGQLMLVGQSSTGEQRGILVDVATGRQLAVVERPQRTRRREAATHANPIQRLAASNVALQDGLLLEAHVVDIAAWQTWRGMHQSPDLSQRLRVALAASGDAVMCQRPDVQMRLHEAMVRLPRAALHAQLAPAVVSQDARMARAAAAMYLATEGESEARQVALRVLKQTLAQPEPGLHGFELYIAARALDRIGHHEAWLVTTLTPLLDADDPTWRSAAVAALAQWVSGDKPGEPRALPDATLEALTRLLAREVHADVEAVLIELVGSQGHSAVAARPLLRARLHDAMAEGDDADDALRSAVIAALSRIGLEELDVSMLLGQLQGADRRTQRQIHAALREAGPIVGRALAQWLRQDDAQVRRLALETMIRIGPQAREAGVAAGELIHGTDTGTALLALRAMVATQAVQVAHAPLLLRILEHESEADRQLYSYQALMQLGPAAHAQSAELIRLMRQGRVRPARMPLAFQTLGHIADHPASRDTARAFLREQIEAQHVGEMRAAIITALGKLGVERTDHAMLETMLRDQHRATHEAAIAVMREHGLDLRPHLLKMLAEPTMQLHALRMVHNLAEPHGAYAAAIAPLMASSDRRLRVQARVVMQQLGEHAAGGTPQLAALLWHEDEAVVMEAMTILVPLGAAAHEATPALMKIVADPQHRYREAALKLLASIGPKAKAALPLIQQQTPLHMGDEHDAAPWINALASIGGDDVASIRLIARTFVQSPSPGNRLAAGTTLTRLGAQAAPAMDLIIPMLEHEQSALRAVAAELLGNLGPAAASTLPQLNKLADDPQLTVRLQAARALQRIQQALQQAEVDDR